MQSSTDFGNNVLAFGEPYADGAQASLVVRPSTGVDGDWGKGTKPLETLPAQWWNWFNKEYTKTLDTRRDTVINILTELDGILGLANITPDGTSGTQMSSFFYGDYLEKVFSKWLDEEAQDIGTLTANDTAIIPIVKKTSDGQTPPEYTKTLNKASLQQLANMLAPYLPTPPAGDTVPVGTMYEYAGVLDANHPAPDGWMQCDGRSLLKTDYPALYDAIGDYWGSADSTHFNIPDMRDRGTMGAGTKGSLGEYKNSATAVNGLRSYLTSQEIYDTFVPAVSYVGGDDFKGYVCGSYKVGVGAPFFYVNKRTDIVGVDPLHIIAYKNHMPAPANEPIEWHVDSTDTETWAKHARVNYIIKY